MFLTTLNFPNQIWSTHFCT